MGRFAVSKSFEKAKVLYGLILSLFSFVACAEPRIAQVRYEGNQTTQPVVMNREIYIASGDVLDIEKVEQSKQAIMDLGLFKSVHYRLQDNQTSAEHMGGRYVDVIFEVEEKYYLLVLPRARSDDNEFYYGIQVRWDNVLGLNHNMRLLYEDRGSTRGIDEKRNSLSYYYPNVNGTTYNINLEAQTLNEVDETEGVIDRQDEEYLFSVSRWLNQKGRNRGWLIGGSIKYQERFNEVWQGLITSNTTDAIILGFDLSYNTISEYEYNRGGRQYIYNLQLADDRIGSDTEYTRHLLTYRSYYRVDGNPLSNLNVQARLGHSNNRVLGKTAFSLGSSDDLRGYDNDRFNDNTMLLMNIEYMFPQPNYPTVRYVYFLDLGNVYTGFSEILHNQLHVGIGAGVRWKIRAFVKLDLRADVGYGVSDEDFHFTFGTRHAF